MTTKVLKEILELKKRVTELTTESKILRSLISKSSYTKGNKNYYNRYAWNRYYNRDKVRETNEDNQLNNLDEAEKNNTSNESQVK